MAKALAYPVIIRTLLDGGYLIVREPVMQRAEYHLYKIEHPTLPARHVGHITEKQFVQLLTGGIIERNNTPSSAEKYGTILSCYTLH